ncbi:MAG: hypothetical protein WD768_04725 [Phycisphaeraceae bacterium]
MFDRYDENLILGYVEGELDDAQLAVFEQQLAADDQLRIAVEAMIADRQMLRDVPAVEAPVQLMNEVTAALEQHMPSDAPANVASPASASTSPAAAPVLYRFPRGTRWIRFSASMAAMLLLAAGLTWQLDPFNWSQPTQPLEMVIVPPPGTTPGNSVNTEGSGGNTAEVAKTPTPTTPTTLVPPAVVANSQPAKYADAAGAGASANANGIGDTTAGEALLKQPDKGTAALALAMESLKQADGFGGLERELPKADAQVGQAGPPVAAAKPAVLPAQLQFQVQVASAQGVTTRDALLGWAQRNGAMDVNEQASRARRATVTGETNRADMKNMRSLNQPRGAQAGAAPPSPATPGGRSNGDAVPADAKSGEDKSPTHDKPQATPAPTPPAAPTPGASDKGDAVNTPVSPAPATQPKRDPAGAEATLEKQIEKSATKDRQREEAAAFGQAPAGPVAPAEAEFRKSLNEAERASAVSQELVLLVPEDRLDGLVQLLESKTGQSLIIVSEQGQTMLVSPQVANERMQARQALQNKLRSDKDAEADADAFVGKAEADLNAADDGKAGEKAKLAAHDNRPAAFDEAKKSQATPAAPLTNDADGAIVAAKKESATDPARPAAKGALKEQKADAALADGLAKGKAGEGAEDPSAAAAGKRIAESNSRDRAAAAEPAVRKVLVRIVISEQVPAKD